VGPHGSAKSFLLERLAQVLNLEYRFYNASLINYDDLVGIPMPTEDRKSLRYIGTATAIWDAEVVFIDELNRTRPELQNKLFPIVHERRVQGIELERLRYRWAAMNPPPTAEQAADAPDLYLGAEMLDPALADRFSFLIVVPGWSDLSPAEQRAVLKDQYTGEHPFATPPDELVARAEGHLEALRGAAPAALTDYVITVVSQLARKGLTISARRATMIHRNILAVHAARIALLGIAVDDEQALLVDWNTSALLSLNHSLPQIAAGAAPDPAHLLGAHRQAWAIAQLDERNPWRTILAITDPLDRALEAVARRDEMDDDTLSRVILDGLAGSAPDTHKLPAAVAMYEACRHDRHLHATAWEALAAWVAPVSFGFAGTAPTESGVVPRSVYLRTQKMNDDLREHGLAAGTLATAYLINVLNRLLVVGNAGITPGAVRSDFEQQWARLRCGCDTPSQEAK
jgi:MoxR-like ATPase